MDMSTRMPISKMLVDGGAIRNLMPWSMFKKLGRCHDDFIKTNIMLNSVGGGEAAIVAKGVASMGITIGNKTLAMALLHC